MIRTMAFSNLAFWHANRLETMTPEIIIDFITVLLHVFTTSDANFSRCIMLDCYLKTKRVRMRNLYLCTNIKSLKSRRCHYYVLWMCSDLLSRYLGNAGDYCILIRVLLKCHTRISATDERWTKKNNCWIDDLHSADHLAVEDVDDCPWRWAGGGGSICRDKTRSFSILPLLQSLTIARKFRWEK